MYSDTWFMIMIEDVKNDKNCWVWNLNIQQKCPHASCLGEVVLGTVLKILFLFLL